MLGQLRSSPVAELLRYILTMLGKRCVLLDPSGGLATHMARAIRKTDLLFAISFRFYATEVVNIVDETASRKVPIIAISDSTLSPLAKAATRSVRGARTRIFVLTVARRADVPCAGADRGVGGATAEEFGEPPHPDSHRTIDASGVLPRRTRASPCARAAGSLDRFDQRLDAQAGAEIERLRAAARDGVEIACDLDRLQIVEAELMARRDAEQAIGRMVRPGLDAAEPLAAARVVGREEMQLVEPLLTEGERALAYRRPRNRAASCGRWRSSCLRSSRWRRWRNAGKPGRRRRPRRDACRPCRQGARRSSSRNRP